MKIIEILIKGNCKAIHINYTTKKKEEINLEWELNQNKENSRLAIFGGNLGFSSLDLNLTPNVLKTLNETGWSVFTNCGYYGKNEYVIPAEEIQKLEQIVALFLNNKE